MKSIFSKDFNQEYDNLTNYSSSLMLMEHLINKNIDELRKVLWIVPKTHSDDLTDVLIPSVDLKYFDIPLWNMPFPFKRKY